MATSTDYNKLKVVDLKAELKKLGLNTSGLKAELVARLEEAATNAVAPDPNPESAPTEDAIEDARNGEEPSEQDADAELKEEAALEPAAEDATIKDATPVPLAKDEPTVAPSTEAPRVVEYDATHPKVAPDSATPASQILPSIPPSSEEVTPVRPAEVLQDSQKRKRRSVSPVPTGDDIARKRARQEEVHLVTSEAQIEDVATVTSATEQPQDVEMGNGQDDVLPETFDMEGAAGETEDKFYSEDQGVYQTDTAMQDEQSQTYNHPDTAGSDPMEMERDVAPSVHPATSALYIKNFMRPLRPQAVEDHLLDLATPPGLPLDENIIINFYLDTIRTHALVLFNSISVASRVRTALHDRIWPDETNRKALWVDFIPPEHFEDWVAMERSSDVRRGSNSRYEVVYHDDGDGNVTARIEEVGGSGPAVSQEPPFHSERCPAVRPRPSTPTGPRGISGIENAPLGPRGFHAGAGPSVHPSRTDRAGLPHTGTFPTVPFQEVPDDLVQRRLAALRASKNREYDYNRDVNKEYKRYFFERGDMLVDRGPEIFLGLRPPARGGGGPPPGPVRRRGPNRPRNRRRDPNRRPHGVPSGGDRFRPGEPYQDRYDETWRDHRGNDRYRGEYRADTYNPQ